LDINGDKTDEVLWTSLGCAMGYGCGTSYNIYDLKSDQHFYMTVITESGEMTKVGEKTYSSNLSQAEYKVFRDFLSTRASTKIPKPVAESKR
jgi:hypothetical protein